MYDCLPGASQDASRNIHKMFSKALFIFLIVNFVSHSYGQREQKFFRKDYTYIDAVESFYKVYSIPNTWFEAKRVCALEGASFWHPENETEFHAVAIFWKKNKPIITYFWSALSDLLVEGRFETIDGKPSSEVYTNWQFNKPDNANGNEDCTHLNTKGEMNDYRCDTKYHFICKKTLQSLEWNYHCDMPNLDYSLSSHTGKCYKLHTTPLNWTEANAMCQIEGATLAVINNRSEANYLAKLAESTPKPSGKGKYQRGIYHVGFHNRFSEGWRTVKGTPMHEDAEAWFDGQQPDEDHEECGSMFFDGRLINTDCDMKSFFICEHGQDNVNCLSQSL